MARLSLKIKQINTTCMHLGLYTVVSCIILLTRDGLEDDSEEDTVKILLICIGCFIFYVITVSSQAYNLDRTLTCL